ncbi:5-oxoprolinase subunit PxpA [Aliidiomarina halalkaliphila]|uniref:5-oxoprolinase subunit A n=1 Tax=Aliidiomarina halalkaliphila TaxID=2593535 RepID=A0A552X3B4_9GAMM|nr:5-oxoprolinase subunit PxpA [Aliidiomarina halalkaliphila]TRW49538.1 5-oxoprolinase subunit PxpA [Aliidiomarina halalkaliphila]
MTTKLRLNCDLGESFGAWTMGNDAEMMPLIDCANIACGFHGGDPLVMATTVALAAQHQVWVGAHPAYPDLVGFGRRSMALSAAEVTATVLYQLGALSAFCKQHNTEIRYVKPHGALYHDMLKNDDTFSGVLKAVRDFDATLPLVILAHPNPTHWQSMADKAGITLWYEAFADRAYQANGMLLPRSQPGAVLADAEAMLTQAMQIAQKGTVTAIDGQTISLRADTLCVHGDTPSALAAVQKIRRALDANMTTGNAS